MEDVPDTAVEPVKEGVRRALHGPVHQPDPALVELLMQLRSRLVRLPENDFGQGVEAGRSMDQLLCPTGELGPFVKRPLPENTREIGGGAEYAMFQRFMLEWFERQSPASLAALDVVGIFTPEMLQALHRVARRQVRRDLFWRIVRDNWGKALTAAGVAGTLVQWGGRIWELLEPWLPAIQGLWRLAKAGGAP